MTAALQLSVPGYSDRFLPEVELHPGKVEKWLASLPLLNVAAGGRKLYTTLNSYNRMELEPALRLKLLELYRSPVQHILTELQKQYVGLPLPLPDKHKSAAEQHREFARELAYGYKYVVLAYTRLAQNPTDMTLALQRAIRYLTETLLASHLSYSPYPANLWREIHALYVHAERTGVAGIAVADALNGAHGKRTVEEAYKHALLLDLGDPYHLPSRMVVKINQYLEGYAGLASLQRRFERVQPNCHFLIDLESDRAGTLYSEDTQLDRPERYCLLNTIELARHIHAQLTQFRDGALPSCALPVEFYKTGGEAMLLRLINVWGLNPKRTFRRTERPDAKVDVVVGLDAINYWLNGARRFVVSAELIGPFQQRTNIGAFARPRDPPQPAVEVEHEHSSWDVQDESAGGMSLRKLGIVRRRVKVGDLVATRLGAGDGWTVGVVRWVKSPNSSNVEIGTQRLAASATPIVVKVVPDNNEESEFLPALLLPAVSALNEPPTLVTPCNVFRPGRTVYMDDGHRLSRLITKQLMEVASGFERIEFDTDSP